MLNSNAQSSAGVILSSDNDYRRNVSLPNQRVSRTKKNKEQWQKDSLDYFINNRRNAYGNRKSQKEIEDNWNFYNNVLSPEELKRELDPFNVDASLKQDELTFKFYNIVDQPLNTLFGEELKRQAEVKAFVINPNIINKKDLEFNKIISDFLNKLVESEQQLSEEDLKKRLKDYDNFKKNDLQTAHEKMSNSIIQGLTNDSNLSMKLHFNSGFKNLQIVSEEIYRIGHVGKELEFNRVNSANFYVFGMGYSPWVQDGYAWVEVDKKNPHQVIEEFAEELTDDEIDDILSRSSGFKNSMIPHKIALVDVNNPDNPHATQALPLTINDEFIALDGEDAAEWDNDGNIRVYRVQWLALRKLGKLKYYDEFGDAQFTWVDETYKIDESTGEEVEWIWVNELWEGTRIMNHIYKKIRPCPVQMRSLINPAIVKPSYIGYVMSNNGIVQKSRIDKLRPYQEMYNIWANKLVKLWTEHIGKMALIDVASLPSNISTEEWYMWAKRFNFGFYNSFEEGKKGAAKGQIAGNMQQKSTVLDLGLAEDINQAIQTLTWIEQRVNIIAAIPEPRQGNLSGNEGLGVSQQAIVSSSHQTEQDFVIHDIVKSKVFEIMIEYIKVLWKDEKGKRQFLLSDLSNYLIDVDGELLNEAEYGIQITNSSQLQEMNNSIRQLTHAAMQTGTATLSDVAKMYMATSPSQMLHDLETAEEKRLEQQNEQVKMQQEGMKAQTAAQKELAQIQHQMEMEKIQLEYQFKLQIEQLKAQYKFNEHASDTNQNHIEDAVELEKVQIEGKSALELQDKKLAADKEMLQIELQAKKEIEKIKSNNKLIGKKQ